MSGDKSVHITATIQNDTAAALERYLTVRKGKKKHKLSRSEAVDDALRLFLGLPPSEE